MKFLGIDYGSRRVGVAVSDDAGRVAFPKAVFTNDADLISKIGEMCRDGGVEKIVIGESLNYKREPNAIDVAAKNFAIRLGEAMGLDVDWENEWLTSAQADRSGGSDDSAAALILQSYLDRQNNV